MIIMHGEAEDTACEENELLKEKISVLNQDISAILEKAGKESKSCDIKKFPKTSRRLSIAINILKSQPETITNCIEDVDLGSVDAKLVSAKLKKNLAKLFVNPAADGIFTCSVSDTSNVVGKTTEDGKITIEFPTQYSDDLSTYRAQNLVMHELLHTAGIVDEDLLYNVLKACHKSSTPTTMNLMSPTKSHISTSSDSLANKGADAKKEIASSVAKSNKNAASSKRSVASEAPDSVNMKSEIANATAIIPSAEKLKVAKIDKSPAGKEMALKDSVQESAPVLRMANQVMGASNTPAMADNSEDSNSNMPASYSRSSNSSSGSSSSSSAYSGTSTYSDSEVSGSSRSGGSSTSGKRYQSRHGRYQSKGSSGDGVGADEFIAEEVDLTKGAQASRSGSSNRGSTIRYQNETGNYNPTAQTTGSGTRSPASSTDEVSRGRGSAVARGGVADTPAISAGGGSPINLGSSSGGGGGAPSAATGTRNTTGRTAASSRAPASASATPINKAQQREIMSTIVDRDYSQVRTELKSDAFQSELKANGIKVIDYNGNRWGAPEGTVIYLDDGSRFIRQR
ncbi:hypothetical protein [Bdellovibrio sp. HCB288]|uniref:hypothetical protein n=1 Tax=Bdellovibrio sp. HCB288 TaxID=3394355 RepID=UPI0039B3DBEB